MLPVLRLSKVDLLRHLSHLLTLSTIDPIYGFTVHSWRSRRSFVITQIRSSLPDGPVIVRSSATVEDGSKRSYAGYFRSIAIESGYDDHELAQTIDAVIESYTKDGRRLRDNDKCFVQTHIREVVCAGVVLTRSGQHDAPYYLIDYDALTGTTNRVTSGARTAGLRIARWLPTNQVPSPFGRLLESIREIESLVDVQRALDVEFAIDKNDVIHVFQVREVGEEYHVNEDGRVRILTDHLTERVKALAQRQVNISGSTTVLADMSDWNPAEMIGARCNPLDYDLYRYLITESAWNTARRSLGYCDVSPSELMVRFGNKPYIDVRVSFNSLTPKVLPLDVRESLVDLYLEEITQCPELQDKVEFEIVLSCYDLTFDERARRIQEKCSFSARTVADLRHELILFTKALILEMPRYAVSDAQLLNGLEKLHSQHVADLGQTGSILSELSAARRLLAASRDMGVVPFARLARLAFVGIALLRSLVKAGVLTEPELALYFKSLHTVTAEMRLDFAAAENTSSGPAFLLSKYGHLRPGTYNICSPRLDSTPWLLQPTGLLVQPPSPTLQNELPLERVQRALVEAGLNVPVSQLLHGIGTMIELRERAKFQFTRAISDVIETIARSGERLKVDRCTMGLVNLDVALSAYKTESQWRHEVLSNIDTNKEAEATYSKVALPAFLPNSNALYVVPNYLSRPNFITSRVVTGPAVVLSASTLPSHKKLSGAVVLIDSADPGYDWIFTHNILALVTQYGGVASHMAIRCAEFGIPGAIGCGPKLFERLCSAAQIYLDCAREDIGIA